MFKLVKLFFISVAVLSVMASQPALANSSAVFWVPAWYASPSPSPNSNATLSNQTVRQIVHLSVDGRQVRIRLSNAYGNRPIHFDKVSIGRRDTGSAVQAGSLAKLTFSGQSDVTIAPGAYALSDPIDIAVSAGMDLSISIYVSSSTPITTAHMNQRNAIYFSDGDATFSEKINQTYPDTGTWASWLWLSEVEVAGSSAEGTVIAFGDSITDGLGLPGDSNSDWPSVLSSRFKKVGIKLGVVNAGITGNRLLHNGQWAPFGVAGLARFESDVLAQPNTKAVIVLLGINDIGQSNPGSSEFVSAKDIQNGLAQLAARAHEKGIRIYVATLAPFKGATPDNYYSDAKEVMRQDVNSWIRTSNLFDGVVDVSKALDDPNNHGQMLPAYDSGDHLHPNAAGDAAIAAAVSLEWFH